MPRRYNRGVKRSHRDKGPKGKRRPKNKNRHKAANPKVNEQPTASAS